MPSRNSHASRTLVGGKTKRGKPKNIIQHAARLPARLPPYRSTELLLG